MTEHNIHLEDAMPLIREKIAAGQTVTFSPRGTSMLPMLVQGRDTVELSALPSKLKKYDLPLYQRDNGQFVLHRIVKAGETYNCIGDNQFVIEYGVEPRQMIAILTAFNHNGKRYSASSLSYRVYCRFWHFSRPVRYIYRIGKSVLRRIFKKS